jgi:O-succinylbenzoic acid--CoA ligase
MREPVDWPTRDPLAHRSETTPERTALVDAAGDREWTVRELDAAVDDLTPRVAELASDGNRLGLLASNRVGFVTAVHAALRTGATLVVFNVSLTTDELTAQVRRADLDGLVCERKTESQATEIFDGPIVSLDPPQHDAVIPFQPVSGRDVDPATWSRDDDAFILFTSGTTGEPKGVRLTLGNLVASATASAFRLGVDPSDRWLCCLPTYHMGGLAPILRTVLYGTTLVLQQTFDSEQTPRVLAQHDVTGVSLVPTQLHRLLETDWQPPEQLQTVLLGGAPAEPELIARARKRAVPVAPTYGMTETASQIATATPRQVRDHPGTVGQPFLFTEVTVVDGSGEPVAAGESGEVVVDGPTVTPGYLDDETTADAFGEFGLSTGDVGRRDEDGRLWIQGRTDDAIVTGGETVYPAEITQAIGSHPQVSDVAVVGLPDPEWGERVAAVVVADTAVTATDVFDHARERLAGYKVPKTVEFVSRIPRTASGTVDRDAVRALLAD